MRVIVRRPRRRQWLVHRTCYRSAAYHPLRPWQVRERRFRSTPLGHRGLDPREVREFLEQVAADLAAVYDALDQSRSDAERIKDALPRWQSEQARTGVERGQIR